MIIWITWSTLAIVFGGYLGYRFGRFVENKAHAIAALAKQVAGQVKEL